jgi:hypothetical protein
LVESAPLALTKGHCPNCGPDRLADVVAGHIERCDQDPQGMIWTITDYSILRCCGCEAVYYRSDATFSEDIDHDDDIDYTSHTITYWPTPSQRAQPDWTRKLYGFNRDLALLFDDVYSALDNNLGVLAAIGMRTVFDRASELLGVDPTLGFADKLNAMHRLRKIGAEEKDSLDVLTNAGSAAAHRGRRPDHGKLDTTMSIIEQFLYRAFILNAEVEALRQSVPPKLLGLRGH